MANIEWEIKSFDKLNVHELYNILAVRQKVFVVEQTCFYQDADGFDQKALHIWAEKDGEILAYCRCFPQGVKYKECSIGRVLTNPKFRNTNLGKTLMTIALECISTRFSTQEVRISAQDYLIPFYENFGFVSTNFSYFEDDIPHTEMFRV